MFGDKLRELRKLKNLKQEELGELCNVAKTTISNWENNITQPPYEILGYLANFFGVSTDYLLGFNQEDYQKIERLRIALKEAGIDDLEKAMQIINILKEDKDTK